MPRFLEIFLALLLLLVLIPFLIPIIIILFLTGEHKVFYLQNRVGYKNQNFKILKFATMLSNSENMGSGSLTLRNDPRVLPFGSFLRKTKINELPQIVNVIIGDLSIVGPRPQLRIDFEKYSKDIQERIYNVKPGLTGIGSIVFRDEEYLISNASVKENPHDFYKRVIAPYKGELEIWYIENRSLMLDIRLILLTVWAIVNPKSMLYEKWFKDLPKKMI